MTHCFSKADQLKLEHWKQKLCYYLDTKALLEKWIFVHVAGVLFAKKPGELIIMKKDMFGLNAPACQEVTASFCRSWDLEHLLLSDNGHSLKIILFRAAAVDRQIAAASKNILHCVLKYPFGLDSTAFLAEVASRWHASGSIPHEIGIALGYPLKDVWGFMGISTDSCSGSCGWKIFGDPEPSMRKKRRYEKARVLASEYIQAA
ncbi:MAG: DUF3793 family protein [Chlorobium sp.]|uniref:DUF3793 family protein n=1 Tax=Chlorobium sp. TaxID=1095 RepID=UPI0025BE5200|nr:DUF3793 family protein [Chlorobium sp.]MCF8382025.1 DUF3793 family protein [Chlorobium sp.]